MIGFLEIDRIIRDADLIADTAYVFRVFFRRAMAKLVGIVPVFHENADNIIALLLQQQRGDGRIDAARHADDDARIGIVHDYSTTLNRSPFFAERKKRTLKILLYHTYYCAFHVGFHESVIVFSTY